MGRRGCFLLVVVVIIIISQSIFLSQFASPFVTVMNTNQLTYP